jgi:hypothetical protein
MKTLRASSAVPPTRSSPRVIATRGRYPGEWDYAGRERMFFAAERSIHEGSLEA